ncbi:MAG TPA: polysaccharide lyase 6 family protein [Bryobacteraceae bacterium]|jgi:poly(beta-D-mannuronate) lyase
MNRRHFLVTSVAAVGAARGTEPVADASQLKEAMRKAVPGDTVLLRDGVWTDADLTIEAEGTPGRPITIRAQTPGRTILTGHSRIRIGGRHLVVDGLYFNDGQVTDAVIAFRASPTKLASECRVTRCVVTGFLAKSRETDTKFVSIYGSKNRFDHCYVAGKINLGTTLVVWLKAEDPVAGHLIDHNHFGPRPRLGLNGGETIRVGDSSTSMLSCKTRVEHNYFEKCNGEVEIVSNKSCDNLYTGNLFERCEGTLTLRHGNRCTVDGNIFLGHSEKNTGGIRIIAEDHKVINNYLRGLTGKDTRAAITMMNGIPNSPLFGYFQVKRAMVANNRVLDCAEPVVIGIGDATKASLPPLDCTFAKNIIVGTEGPLVQLLNPLAEVYWDGNVFYGADTGLKGVAAAPAAPAVGRPPAFDRSDAGPDWFKA